MKHSYHFTDIKIRFDKDDVLRNIECYKDNPNYESYLEELDEVCQSYLSILTPTGYVTKNNDILNVIISLGKDVDEIISNLFAQYDYMKAMLLNSLADQVLFHVSEDLFELLKREVSNDNLFLTSRREPGQINVPIETQKDILKSINDVFITDIFITEGYMLAPSKSLGYYYELSEEDIDMIDHDCSLCDDLTCKNRHYQVRITFNDQTKTHKVLVGTNLLDVLRKYNYHVEAPCSGKMLCGKCKVKAVGHQYNVSVEELRFLSEKEATDDTILACFHIVDRHLDIVIDSIEKMAINGDIIKVHSNNHNSSKFGIAVDLGTTSVVVALINLKTGDIVDSIRELNPQKAFGNDVISRIQYYTEKDDKELTVRIQNHIVNNVKQLLENEQLQPTDVEKVIISGNTTMAYLFLGINPTDLGVAPFTTLSMDEFQKHINKCTLQDLNLDVEVYPYISAYIGGDIISGIYALDMHKKDDIILFVDIGTNGEIALKKGNQIHTVSTAAGPAFEGGNIKCGLPSFKGAVSGYRIIEGKEEYDVIGDTSPIGICGTGIIDVIAALLDRGDIDQNGYLKDPFPITQDVLLYPEDVRQIQLSKSAIYAGIKTILEIMDTTYQEIDTIYISGGFGTRLNIENALKIGLLPSGIDINKVNLMGNTSLSGAIKKLVNPNDGDIEDILNQANYTELSADPIFYNHYIMGMYFGDGFE